MDHKFLDTFPTCLPSDQIKAIRQTWILWLAILFLTFLNSTMCECLVIFKPRQTFKNPSRAPYFRSLTMYFRDRISPYVCMCNRNVDWMFVICTALGSKKLQMCNWSFWLGRVSMRGRTWQGAFNCQRPELSSGPNFCESTNFRSRVRRCILYIQRK